MRTLPFDPLLAAIAVPLLAALVIAAGLPKRWSVRLAYGAFAVPLLMALHVWWHFSDQPQTAGFAFLSRYSTGLDALGISLHLGLNGISLPLFVLAGIVGFAAGLYALQSQAERLKLYLLLLLVMQGGLMGIFASVDILFLYFFHELALIPTFIMVGIWGGRDRGYAAMKLTIYLTLGAMVSLAGLIVLYARSGANTFDLLALREHLARFPLEGGLQSLVFGLLLAGLGVLVSLWPLHTWAPLGYGAAPSSNAMLHAGVLKKFGLYTLLQVALPLAPAGHATWAAPLAWLAVVGNVLVVGLVTIAQRDLKQMIGYSSVMHMGYAFLGIACGTAAGLGGALFLMVAHGLSVALLFLLATSVHHRTRTFALDEMGGLAGPAPALAAFFTAATFAGIGLPGLANFWGELAIFAALWKYSPVLAVLAVAGVVLSAIYGLRAVARIFFGPPTERFAEVAAREAPADLRRGERLPALVLLAALLFLGFWPKALSVPIQAALATPAPAVAAARPAPAR